MAKRSFQPKRLLLVHAHPDDESLFTGHVIADRMAAGAEVFVLTLTRGERGKVKLADLKSLEGRYTAMGAFRTAELMNALQEYNTDEHKLKHSFAGTRSYLDSGMRINSFGRPARKRMLDEMSLSAAATQVIADDIFKVLKDFRPDAVVTYNRKGGFGHPDHKKAYEATAMAIRQYAKSHRAPALWVIAEPGERFDVSLGTTETALIKKSALEAHASQVQTQSETYSLVAGKEIRYDEPERLRLSNPSYWHSLKPWLHSLWALPAGILTGVAGTMLHLIQTEDNAIPVGLVVALLMVGSLALALRILRRSRGALYLMALGFLVTIFQLSGNQPGGEQFLTNSTISAWWLYGSSALLALIMLFPRIQPAVWRQNASGHR
jgi:N-acetyl-1-D-myo-inositol-2-amino-2-deoxy-alpha-D-glucopyranoside deacetylase